MKYSDMQELENINEGKLSGDNLKDEIKRIARIATQPKPNLDKVRMLIINLSKNI